MFSDLNTTDVPHILLFRSIYWNAIPCEGHEKIALAGKLAAFTSLTTESPCSITKASSACPVWHHLNYKRQWCQTAGLQTWLCKLLQLTNMNQCIHLVERWEILVDALLLFETVAVGSGPPKWGMISWSGLYPPAIQTKTSLGLSDPSLNCLWSVMHIVESWSTH